MIMLKVHLTGMWRASSFDVVSCQCWWLLVSLISSTGSGLLAGHCFEGTYNVTPKKGKDVCERCPKGTFMPFEDHQLRECFNCTKIQNPDVDILISPCNRTQDAVIHCKKGYFWRRPRNPRETGECTRCTECIGHVVIPCQTFEDTHCCPAVNYDVVVNKDGVLVCRERPWLCRRGQYFRRLSFECLPCPENTYMSLDYHSQTECWICQNLSEDYLPLHSHIRRPCNATHPALLGCDDGYYVSPFMGYRNIDFGCSPCKICNATDEIYVGRECDGFNDTVCCPKPDMKVNDTLDGPKCTSPLPVPDSTTMLAAAKSVVVCGPGQYISISSENATPATCQPCPNGTYMEEDNHAKTLCKDCSDPTETIPSGVCPAKEADRKQITTGVFEKSYFTLFNIFAVLFGVSSFVLVLCLILFIFLNRKKCMSSRILCCKRADKKTMHENENML